MVFVKLIYKKSLHRRERKSLLNLTKVRFTTNGNGSMNMNMEKGGTTMNITMMTLI